MEIDFSKILKRNTSNNIQPRRSLIYVGFLCHLQCGFCYYKNHNSELMFNKEYVIRLIDLEISYGIHDFEITGGEPAECLNLLYYCKYIKNKSPKSKIAIITNGSLCFYTEEIWKYIDEVLISYHLSKNNNFYSKEIFPLGTTYNKVSKCIKLAKLNNKLIRTNTVIGKFNINLVYDILDDLLMFKPDIINFLPVNLFDDANSMENFIDYTKLRPILKKCFDRINLILPNSLSFVRYMPFCDMEGYELHIVGSWLHIYDWFDWNPELCGQYLLDYLNKYSNNDDILKYLGNYGSKSFSRTYDCVKYHYEKNEKCLKCKYYLICDGVEKTKNHILLNQIKNVPGNKILNIMFFIKLLTYDFYIKKYKI